MLTAGASTGTERGGDGTFLVARALTNDEEETRDATSCPTAEGSEGPSELVLVTMRQAVRNQGTNCCGAYAQEVGMNGEASPATTIAWQSKANRSALTSGSPSWATRAWTPRRLKQSLVPQLLVR